MITSLNSSSIKNDCLDWENQFCWDSSFTCDPQKFPVFHPPSASGDMGSVYSVTEPAANWCLGAPGSNWDTCKKKDMVSLSNKATEIPSMPGAGNKE